MRPVALLFCTFTALLFSVSAAPVAQAAGPRVDSGERAVVRAINKARGQHGIKRLRSAPRLARAADVHTRSMLVRNYFSHGAFAQRVRRYVSFRRIGETIAWSSRCSARGIVRMWLNSPGHRAVLLSRGYRRVGVGRRTGRLGSTRACVVTADFGSRR
jgi:uncharacterized protein YkwD